MTSNDPTDDSAADACSPRARRMDELSVVLDRIVEADRELATIAACRAELIEAARRLSVADAVATAEEGCRSVQDTGTSGWTAFTIAHRELISELACALRVPERTASTLVEHSRALVEDLSATLTALSAGEISYRHAQTLADHAASLPADAVAGFESAALPHARELTVAKFDRKARIEREHSHPETILERVGVARDTRNVFVEPARDGMAWLNAYLPAETAIASYNRIDDIAAGLQCADECRTLGQLRADVLTDLLIDGTTHPDPAPESVDPTSTTSANRKPAPITDADFEVLLTMQMGIAEYTGIDMTLDAIAAGIAATTNATINATSFGTDTPTGTEAGSRALTGRTRASRDGIGHGIRAKVLVTVPVLTLLGHSADPGTLEGYGPIDPDTAKRLAADAPSFTRILTHPETGTVLSVGRDSYAVPADLKLWLRIRDETCRHPGCNRQARRCDIDHTHDWQRDGCTEYDNLAHLCPGHHRLKHHTAWTAEHGDAGVLDWTSPTGKHYQTRPAITLRTPRFE